MDVAIGGSLVAHFLTLFVVVWVAGRVNLSGRFLLFFALFYGIAPLVPFTGFEFFQYEVSYSYDPRVLLLYSLSSLFFVLVAFVLQAFPCAALDVLDVDTAAALRVLWCIALVAWLIDIAANWSFFLLPKHEYIASIPQQTKNLFLFTIPAAELLAGAFALSPFRSVVMRRVVAIVGVLAVLQSLVLGYRHVALLALLLILLPRVRSLGVLTLCLFLTFIGEISNGIKLFFSPASGIQGNILDAVWWREYLEVSIGVSTEQKAILSNLLIKLAHPEFIDYWRGFLYLVAGLFGSIISRIGVEVTASTAELAAFVGTLEGQGTGYSIQLSIIESFGLVLPFVVLVGFLARATVGTMLFILAAEIMFSMMRNGPEYWLAQVNKLIFLIFLVWLLSLILQFVRVRSQSVAPRLPADL
ncbi:MAG: hypothetical protein ROZ64_12280 [Burkholderiaceae bacterium]|jgi:hypothetical protein|nr:hypothetical protein [Burkholderiaceae bacterium]